MADVAVFVEEDWYVVREGAAVCWVELDAGVESAIDGATVVLATVIVLWAESKEANSKNETEMRAMMVMFERAFGRFSSGANGPEHGDFRYLCTRHWSAHQSPL